MSIGRTELDARRTSPQLVLSAYRQGLFPMGVSGTRTCIYWESPAVRGIILPERFHVSTRLRRSLRQNRFKVTRNADFAGVISGCADREVTWINAGIVSLYSELHRLGHAHSIEVWDQDQLAGGLYGVSLGRAFHGESMFSRKSGASKFALAYLVAHLAATGFVLLDVQWNTEHLRTMGAVSIPRYDYLRLLKAALAESAEFASQELPESGAAVLQRISQTS